MTTAPYTIGIEEEYQVVDPETGALRSAGTLVRNADWTDSIIPEMQESTVEIGTPICRSASEAREQLRLSRLRTSAVAASEGLAIVAAGLHPFSRWEGHTRPDEERYREIVSRYGRIARDEHIFGMHIHVAIPEGVDRIPLMNVLRHYLSLLLALSTSSAFFEGEDTSFASYRTIIWRRWPSSGVTPRFRSQEEFDSYVDTLLAAGTIRDRGNLYWSMRPHGNYPTIEFRITDVCPGIDDAVAIAALARSLTAAAREGVIRDDPARRVTDVLEQEILRVNEWRVARDGLNARIVNAMNGTDHDTVRNVLRRTLDIVHPIAQQLGDGDALSHVHTIVDRGTASDRMRVVYAQQRSMKDVIDWLQNETLLGVGLDQRQLQRAP
jgi:carboxylate-amine ligase